LTPSNPFVMQVPGAIEPLMATAYHHEDADRAALDR
jgi:hypothetical protein